MNEMQSDTNHVLGLRELFINILTSGLGPESFQVNGSLTHRYAGNLNISFANIDGDALFSALNSEIAVSAGQACVSDQREPSYILTAIGVERDLALNAMRIGFGRFTTEEEVIKAAKLIVQEVQR